MATRRISNGRRMFEAAVTEPAGKATPANDNRNANLAPCDICGRPRTEKYSPFCSRRCADVDLYRWLKGSYVIPGSEESEDGERVGDKKED